MLYGRMTREVGVGGRRRLQPHLARTRGVAAAPLWTTSSIDGKKLWYHATKHRRDCLPPPRQFAMQPQMLGGGTSRGRRAKRPCVEHSFPATKHVILHT